MNFKLEALGFNQRPLHEGVEVLHLTDIDMSPVYLEGWREPALGVEEQRNLL